MKKLLLFTAVSLLLILDGYSQATFNTGALRVDVNQYGRIRLFTPAGVRQLQRASILVGTSPTTVFDYTNDSDGLDPTVLVASPAMSDFEIYGSFDNGFSSLPPAVVVKLNAYGWTNAGYTIVKFNVKSDEASSINASIGLEIIPEINQTYGFDSVTYNTSAGVIRFHRGAQVNMGMKLLSASLSSLYSFEWYDGYTADTSLWKWMNHGSLQPQYASNTADGPVTITSQSPVALANSQTFNVYYAMALGANEAEMLANISAAVLKYQSMIVSVNDLESSVNGFNLGQNHPNPFKQSTSISYQLPDDGFVSIKIYNVLGNEVASLVNSNQTKGSYTIPFNANGLPSGVYSYTLRFGNQVRSNKMLLVK
ncbi:MAG: T9SS type A sorting domain-containing protein [Bacteroidales bacterium]